MDVRIEVPGGLEAAALVAGLAAHTVPGAERTDTAGLTHERLVPTAGGRVAARVAFDSGGVDLGVGTEDPATASDVAQAIRRWLDLSADLGPVREALGRDPDVGPCIEARPGLRVVGTTGAFQTAVTTVLGQQVSLAAARTFAGRLVAAFGEPGPSGLTAFPTAGVLAGLDTEQLRSAVGLTAARARTVGALAAAVATADASGHHRAGGTHALPLSRAELLAVPGIGPWTADYLGLRYGDRDAFAPGDLVVRRALGGVSAREAAERAEAWRPFRAYAITHLWTASAYAATAPRVPRPAAPPRAGTARFGPTSGTR